VDNNPIYASAVSILAVFLLFFIIIGNLWTIEGEYYSMSESCKGDAPRYLGKWHSQFHHTW